MLEILKISPEVRGHPFYKRTHVAVSTYLICGIGMISVSDWLAAHSFFDIKPPAIQTVFLLVFVVATALILNRLFVLYTTAIVLAERERHDAFENTVSSWSELLAVRSKETEEHSLRVTRMTENFARLWGIESEELDDYRRGALLHDIGKLHIPDHILNKPGPLNEEEWTIVREHPTVARRMLQRIPYVKGACHDIPAYHHERWDGSGYPDGIGGADIPLSARLFSIIDVWEAMTHKRIYKIPLDETKVLQHIKNSAGTQFDPDLAIFFVENYQAIKQYGAV